MFASGSIVPYSSTAININCPLNIRYSPHKTKPNIEGDERWQKCYLLVYDPIPTARRLQFQLWLSKVRGEQANPPQNWSQSCYWEKILCLMQPLNGWSRYWEKFCRPLSSSNGQSHYWTKIFRRLLSPLNGRSLNWARIHWPLTHSKLIRVAHITIQDVER